jgi:WD40 repeat protein
MNRDDAELDAEPFSDMLAAYDDDLAAGRTPVAPTTVPPELSERLARAQACLRRLDQERQRAAAEKVSGPFLAHEVSRSNAQFGGAKKGPDTFSAAGLELDADGVIRQVGRWRIVRELGRGGNGIVYLAWDPLLHREVAVKLPRPHVLLAPGLRRRFLREAQAAAGLDHPNLVPVYETGEVGSFCYIVSAYCRGTTLGAWLKAQDRLVAPRLAANLVATLADAVAYIHRRGILHRDIKPNNILLQTSLTAEDAEERRGREADAMPPRSSASSAVNALVPKLTDFGLAKQAEELEDETKSGTVLGTPLYMAPEQAEGRLRDIGPRTDLYSLGVILYELLTGRPPFRGDFDWNIRAQITGSEPVPLRRLRPEVPRDLETICLKCLQKDPRDRYACAEALADDLRRFQEGRPVAARPVRRWERIWTWAKRRPAAAALLLVSCVAALLSVGGAVGLWYHGRLQGEFARAQLAMGQTEQALEREREAKGRETAALERLEQLSYLNRVRLAYRAWQDNQLLGARQLLDDCPERFRNWEWAYTYQLCHPEERSLRGPSGSITSVALSADGQLLATGCHDRTITVWDLTTAEQICSLRGHTGAVSRIVFSPDGRSLAVWSEDQTIKVWDVTTGRAIHTFRQAGSVRTLAFSPDGRRLASGTARGGSGGNPEQEADSLRVWDLVAGKQVFERVFSDKEIFSLAFSPDNRRLAYGAGNAENTFAPGTLEVLDALSGQAIFTLNGHSLGVGPVAFSPDGKYLASGSGDKKIKLWDARTGEERLSLLHPDGISTITFSPDGLRLASLADIVVRVWDLKDGREVVALKGHDHTAGISFSRDGRHLISISAAPAVKIRNAPIRSQEFLALKGHTDFVDGLAFSPDGRFLASASQDHTVKIWDALLGKEAHTLKGHRDSVHSVCFSPDGLSLASASTDATVRIWDGRTGQEQCAFEHAGPVYGVAFDPSGKRLASAGQDQTIKLWDLATGREIRTLRGHTQFVLRVAFSPDGRRLASAAKDQTVKLWDTETGQMIWSGTGHTDRVTDVSFSPDGRLIASSSYDATIRLWDASTGREILTLKGHTHRVIGCRFSPDGRRLVSGSDDRLLKLWDVNTGQEALSLRGHQGPIHAVAFSPDGRRIASAGWDTMVRVWDSGHALGIAPGSPSGGG